MSLDMVIDYLAESGRQRSPSEMIRIVLGHEPNPAMRASYGIKDHHFDREIANYWLSNGISLYQSAKVLVALDMIDSGRVSVRISLDQAHAVHAKIFKGDYAVTVGSSNFSYSGMQHQIEANSRYTSEEGKRFQEACSLAERIWELGRGYTGEFRALLEQLLHAVTWEEALGRACAEVLEGAWARKYTVSSDVGDATALWPSQQQGIAQAMWVLENVGSVLVADATGSGKTRVGAHLIGSTMQRIWGSGRMRQDVPMIICPSNVQDNWRRATAETGKAVEIFSDGSLSSDRADSFETLTLVLRRAQVLAIDEGHRFLNRTTQRTQRIFNNMADHVLLFTATPINRSVQDLLSIVDLLGADNFDEEVLDIMVRVLRRQRQRKAETLDESVSQAEHHTLQHAIQQFTVRRTKTMLNDMIDSAPHLYKNALGAECRYPEHSAKTYSCGETEVDRTLAAEIRESALRLRGLFALKSLMMPDWMRKEYMREAEADGTSGDPEVKYLARRVAGAKGLAVYNVMEGLRSSRAALIEHILGTARAREHYGISASKSSTGNIVETLRGSAGHLPPCNLGINLPDWLSDPEAHRRACEEETAIYQRIAGLAMRVSDAREQTKAKHLVTLLKEHKQIVAFDSHPITLLDLQQRAKAIGGCTTIVATGEASSGRKQVKELTRLGSSASQLVALCSDSMSEGFNLQSASAVVHLDMPSVIRQAEQRIGRVDRMDSPHRSIEVYWPEDAPQFALRTDERFYARHELVAQLLGSNIPLPGSGAPISTEGAIQELEEGAKEAKGAWDGITDAFAPVRSMVSGEEALVPATVYQQVRESEARLVSSVSAVEARRPWAFFAVAGTKWGAPRWIYMDSLEADPISDLDAIVERLRDNLTGRANRAYDETAATLVGEFLDRLKTSERLLLPRKKQHALVEMEKVLKAYLKDARSTGDRAREGIVRDLLEMVTGTKREHTVDLNALAEWWLDLIRPIWYERLKTRRGLRPLLLRNIRRDVIAAGIETYQLQAVLERDLLIRPLDARVASAIVGVPYL